jgi:hypothetical protein
MPALAETSSPVRPSLDVPHVGTGGASYTDRLADLEATAAAANERVRAARSALQTRRGDAARQVAADLMEYRDAIEARKPSATREADRPTRERELTVAYCEAIKRRGLVLMPIGEGTEVQVIDPALSAEYDAAMAASVEASRAVQKFEKAHAADLAAERRRADAERIREAIAGDDGDAIREALVGRPGPSSVFTTADLPRRSRRG